MKVPKRKFLNFYLNCFSPASRIILIESLCLIGLWKPQRMVCFSPASRIILIERLSFSYPSIVVTTEVSVPQAGLF